MSSVRALVGGRTVVLTGAAGGIGRCLAATLAGAGGRLLLVDIDPDGLAEVAGRVDAGMVVADIATASGRAAIDERRRELRMPADILINNAAVERASEFTDLTEAEIVHAVEVNLVGAMLLSRQMLPEMRRLGRGHVISVSSLAGIKPIPFNALYNATKSALVAFSLSLTKELAGTGVSATVVCPAAVRDAGMWARASGGLSRNRMVESSTIGVQDVADAVLHAVARRPARVLVGSPMVRAGALLSAAFPRADAAMDRVSGLRSVYRQRIRTDRENRL
jgi:short-subunit dehydrogenase